MSGLLAACVLDAKCRRAGGQKKSDEAATAVGALARAWRLLHACALCLEGGAGAEHNSSAVPTLARAHPPAQTVAEAATLSPRVEEQPS